MVESFEIIKRPKRICRGRGRGTGGRCLHRSDSEVGGDVFFTLELCRSEDVLIEILSRLPLKAIFRFKCVSKRWHQLISEDHFRVKVIERNKMDLGPLYFFQTPVISDHYHFEITEKYATGRHSWNFLAESNSVSNYKFGERLEVESDVIINGSSGNVIGGDDFRFFMCCSNGLLLCLVSHWIKSQPPWTCPPDRRYYSRCYRFYQHVMRYYIYNPLTKLGYLLPYSPKQSQRHLYSHTKMEGCRLIGRDCVALVVGSSSSSSADDDDDDDIMDGYKVVRAVASLSNNNTIELETFSSHTGEWRLSTVTVTADIHECFSIYSKSNFSVRVRKGAIYWMVGFICFQYIFVYSPPPPPDTDNTGGGVIEMIKAPPCDGRNQWLDVGIGESVDGLLQVTTVNRSAKEDDYLIIKIWVYHPQPREDCSRWLLRRQLPLPANIRPVLDSDEQMVISFHPLNPNILFMRCCGWIFACHLNTNPMLVEPSVRFNLLHRNVIVQPYLPPPWPISPFPAAAAARKK